MTAPEPIRSLAARLLTEVVEPAVHGPGHPLGVEAHHVGGEPIGYHEARRRPREPFPVGGAWGPAWDTTWFRLSGAVPAGWAGREVVVRFEHVDRRSGQVAAESLLWRDGAPFQGLCANHPAAVLYRPATGGEPVEVWVEAAANPVVPEQMAGIDWPLLRPDPGGEPLFVLARAELAVRHGEVFALAADLRAVLGLMAPGGAASLAGAAHEALAAAVAALDPADVAGTTAAARVPLRALLDGGGGDGPRVSAVGHAHIDTAWLWPLRETVRKCARTFATAVTLMEEYPEYHFVCSAAQHLHWMEEHYPDLFSRIAQRVETGHFGPVGAMWVEADCNIPSGESLVRQVVYGKRYFASRFGVDCRELWLPDAFGYTAALPQIMAAAGVEWFVSQKLSWNDTTTFPHHTFWWEGLDGTRVRAHFPTADTYNGNMSAREILRSGRAPRSLYPFGYGDGGGGPTREMLEAARRLAGVDGVPRVALEPAGAFFAAVEADPDPLPVWAGELYLETHRGTFTSQAAIKAGNRRAESALAAAELWSAAGRDAGDWPAEELEAAWKLLLVNQFHDILPGSGIRWVAEQAETELAEVCRRADALAAVALDALAGAVDTTGLAEPVVVFNPAPFDRREVVEIGGRPGLVDVPALGYTTIDSRRPGIDGAPAPSGATTGPGWLRNEHLEARFDEAGRLVRLLDRDLGREVVPAGRAGNEFHLHADTPADYDAWNVDRDYLERFVVLDGPAEAEVVEAGGVRAALRFRRRFGEASVLHQTVVLHSGSRRIDFVTEVDWREDHRFLKVAFPVTVRAPEARFEVAFGHLRRPTEARSDFDRARFEVCAHRWADLSGAGFGVALLNDSKYGYDVRGDVLRLSLLRAPTAPDPICDRGRHRFTYALLPHGGDLGEVLAGASALNAPLALRPAPGGRPGRLPARRSFVTVDDPGFVVSSLKRADDGDGFVLRGYEGFGAPRVVRVEVALPFTAATRTDLLEGDHPGGTLAVAAGAVTLSLRPFELVTLRLR